MEGYAVVMVKPMVIYYPASRQHLSDDASKPAVPRELAVYNYPPDNFASKREELLTLCRRSEPGILVPWLGGKVSGGCVTESAIELVLSLTEADWADVLEKSSHAFVGFSDVTYFLCALQNRDIPCFYGPNFYALLLARKAQRRQMIAALTDVCSRSCTAVGLEGNGSAITLSPRATVGRLVGGNFQTFYDLYRWFPAFMLRRQAGDVLFLEDADAYYVTCGGSVIGPQAEKYQLFRDIGFFDRLNGLILGRTRYPRARSVLEQHSHFIDSREETAYIRCILRSIGLSDIPILSNVPCGHCLPCITLPLGHYVTFSADRQSVDILA